MTFEELNIIRKLKKQLADENKKLSALKIVVGAFPHKYGKAECNTATVGAGNSPFESFVTQIADAEKRIESLQLRIRKEVPQLTKKIQENFTASNEQTLLIYRYVACEYFRDIGFLMGYSERRVYQMHEKLIKKFSVDCS